MSLLEIDNLRLAIHARGTRTPVLRGVDLRLDAGGILGLVGESGGGKTMVGKAILGVLPESARIESGAIRFDGKDLLALPATERRASTLRTSRSSSPATESMRPTRAMTISPASISRTNWSSSSPTIRTGRAMTAPSAASA